MCSEGSVQFDDMSRGERSCGERCSSRGSS